MARELTPKQRRFVEEYLVDLNAKQSAIRAGYSERTAEEQGYQLLRKTSVARAIEAAMSERSARTALTADYVLLGLQEVAERCLQHKPVMEWDRESRSMVQATTAKGEGIWEFDSAGANRAFELLGKHLKLFVDRQEVNAEVRRRYVDESADEP